MPIVQSNIPTELRGLAEQAGAGNRVEREDALQSSALNRDLARQQAGLQQEQSDRQNAAFEAQQAQQAFANQFAIRNLEDKERDQLFAQQRLVINEQTRVREAKEERERNATALIEAKAREDEVNRQKQADLLERDRLNAIDAKNAKSIEEAGKNKRQNKKIVVDFVSAAFDKAEKGLMLIKSGFDKQVQTRAKVKIIADRTKAGDYTPRIQEVLTSLADPDLDISAEKLIAIGEGMITADKTRGGNAFQLGQNALVSGVDQSLEKHTLEAKNLRNERAKLTETLSKDSDYQSVLEEIQEATSQGKDPTKIAGFTAAMEKKARLESLSGLIESTDKVTSKLAILKSLAHSDAKPRLLDSGTKAQIRGVIEGQWELKIEKMIAQDTLEKAKRGEPISDEQVAQEKVKLLIRFEPMISSESAQMAIDTGYTPE